VNDAIDITHDHRRIILGLLEKNLPDTVAWIYGSRIKCTSRPNSDLDLVVFSAPDQKMQVYNLKEAFEESDLPFRVDLFIWHDIPKQFQENIKNEHVVLQEGKNHLKRNSVKDQKI
jgi:predicted nucleotidyltransferase